MHGQGLEKLRLKAFSNTLRRGHAEDSGCKRNSEPLNFKVGQNRSNYFTDYSDASAGGILNPMLKDLLTRGRVQTPSTYLRSFFGPALQRQNLLFYTVIDVSTLEQKVCQKTIFPVNTIPALQSMRPFFWIRVRV